MNALLLAAAPVQDTEAAHTAISSDAVLFLMLGVGIFMTLALIGFFGFVIWNETRKDREHKRESGS